MRLLFSTFSKYISLGITTFLDNFSARADTSGGLETSTSGSAWDPVNGIIEVKSGAAKATTSPTSYSAGSSYPMSSVSLTGSDVQISLKGTNQGSTAAIWIQSADEWWGVTARAVLETTAGNTNYGFTSVEATYFPYATYSEYAAYGYDRYQATGTGYNATAGANYKFVATDNSNYGTGYTKVAYFIYGFNSSTTYSVATYKNVAQATYGTRYNSKYALAYTKYSYFTSAPSTYSSSTNYAYKVNATYYAYNTNYNKTAATSYSTATANTFTTYGTNTNFYNKYVFVDNSTYNVYNGIGTNYGYDYIATGTNAATYAVNQYLDIIRSTTSSVNTISSSLVSAVSTIGSIFISLFGNEITARAYSDTNLVTQIGSDLVYTATGAIISTQFGIAVSPSAYNQSDIIGTSVEISLV